MPRKKFLQDLEQVKGNPPAHITDIDRYEDDGVSLTYWYSRGGLRQEVCLKLITTNLDEYPDCNQFMLFTDNVDVDPIITDAFVQIQAIIDGCSISTALREISGGLQQAITLGLAENPIVLDTSSQPSVDSDVDDFDPDSLADDDDDDASFGLDDMLPGGYTVRSLEKNRNNVCDETMTAIKIDLRAAKDAGFKVGVYNDLLRGGILCISIRVAKLGISEEAMKAWPLEGNQYLVLLIRFMRGYKFLAHFLEQGTLPGSVEMRVALCDNYKPNYHEASAIFTRADSKEVPKSTQQFSQVETLKPGALKPLFIGQPIDDLLQNRFPKIVQFRHQFNLHWGGAERLFNDRQGVLLSELFKDLSSYREPERLTITRALPKIVMEDALSQHGVSASLPLVAMQFVLRHLVRCTEFCLVCHCRVEDTFEALKPYVCSNPLCLYQFLALGFGPSAEWEILSQPYVVDLLISLCYAQAQASRMREFPLGINLKIPMLPSYKTTTNFPPEPYYRHGKAATTTTLGPTPVQSLPESVKAFSAKYYLDRKILAPVPDSWAPGKQSVRRGDWLVLISTKSGTYHCHISDEQGLNFALGTIIHCDSKASAQNDDGKDTVKKSTTLDVDCYLYDTSFDDLPNHYRYHAIMALLDTLPSITNMRRGLATQQGGQRDASLKLLRDQCPQAALDLLRWIIASNRSCIMQVDQVAARTAATVPTPLPTPSEDRVSGMDDWMQFRFAQGAPDKEQRFTDCMNKLSMKRPYPTLFAWHGSPLGNWHSIIRQGLNYDEVLHGRASGNGVYMSPFLGTSMSYVGHHSRVPGTASGWPNSELQVQSVVSLQEVVNAPESFVSVNPHFVVADKDWIQTRYLFVKTSVRHSIGSVAKNSYPQDPKYNVKGLANENVIIPITAIPQSRRTNENSSSVHKSKKQKTTKEREYVITDFDDGMSVTTDTEDRRLLEFETDNGNWYGNEDIIMTDAENVLEDFTNRTCADKYLDRSKKRSFESNEKFILDTSKTDFVPGALDTSGIRFLDPPNYASTVASKALLRAFTDAIKTQETTPLHELGFYLDPNRLDNMYQWIVELHSFEKSLPLAQDMKYAGIASIVIEMQFTSDFPFSPPFVRVVKPRFLDPMMGGGGHITQGGAICMELLTSSGWSAVNSMENVLLQVRLAMTERERPARLVSTRKGEKTQPYLVGEAIAAYKRFCDRHGWKVPKGLDSIASL